VSYIELFSMPTPVKITGRTSSITNSFINSIIPIVPPTEEDVREALSILGMTPETFQCAYCGAPVTEWDHLRPLVLNKKPTGYISEIHNLVPACGKCNQSKGNKNWRVWMLSDAKRSPKTKEVADLSEKVARLGEFESWGVPTKIDFVQLVGDEVWDEHWRNWEQICGLMKQSQGLADQINQKVAETYLASEEG
jgi:hypothetical protein